MKAQVYNRRIIFHDFMSAFFPIRISAFPLLFKERFEIRPDVILGFSPGIYV